MNLALGFGLQKVPLATLLNPLPDLDMLFEVNNDLTITDSKGTGFAPTLLNPCYNFDGNANYMIHTALLDAYEIEFTIKTASTSRMASTTPRTRLQPPSERAPSRPQRRSRLLPSSTSSVPSSVTGPAAELPRPSKASRLRQVAMQVWPWLPLHLVVPSVGTWSPGDSVCPVHPHTR